MAFSNWESGQAKDFMSKQYTSTFPNKKRPIYSAYRS